LRLSLSSKLAERAADVSGSGAHVAISGASEVAGEVVGEVAGEVAGEVVGEVAGVPDSGSDAASGSGSGSDAVHVEHSEDDDDEMNGFSVCARKRYARHGRLSRSAAGARPAQRAEGITVACIDVEPAGRSNPKRVSQVAVVIARFDPQEVDSTTQLATYSTYVCPEIDQHIPSRYRSHELARMMASPRIDQVLQTIQDMLREFRVEKIVAYNAGVDYSILQYEVDISNVSGPLLELPWECALRQMRVRQKSLRKFRAPELEAAEPEPRARSQLSLSAASSLLGYRDFTCHDPLEDALATLFVYEHLRQEGYMW
jgi:DNA polymerase III epsilon subunit-like protein